MKLRQGWIERYQDKLTLLISFLISYLMFLPVFKAPGKFIFGVSGDALKNYFTLAYYVRNDSGVLFSGMNYPYGEIVTYTDNQPLLAWILQSLSSWLPTGDHVVGIQNLLLILSPVITAWLISLILKRLGVHPVLNIIGSVLIAFLSPQIHRLTGHYGLAYSWLVPGIWYLSLRFEEAKSREFLWAGSIAVYILAMGLLHPYNAVISLLFVLSRSFVSWIYKRDMRALLLSFGSALVGIILFLVIQNLMDGFDGRPKFPYGIYIYNADLEGFFAPFYKPLHPVFNYLFNTSENVAFEKRMYIGIVSIFMVLALLFRFFSGIKRSIRFRRLPGTNVDTRILWWQVLIVFLVASGTMHTLVLEHFIEIFPPIAQFRGLARFGWIIYYLISIYTVYWLHLWYRQMKFKGMKRSAVFGLGLLAIFWIFDDWHYNKQIKSEIMHKNDLMDPKISDCIKFLSDNDLNADDFQAILVTPIIILGSEKIDRGKGDWFLREGMEFAFHTGLPLVNIMMSRTPMEFASSYLELYAPDYVHKRRSDDWNDKPLLMFGWDYESLDPREKAWADKSELIGAYRGIKVYNIPVSVFKETSLTESCNDQMADSLDTYELPVFYEDFDGYGSEHQYLGKGAYQFPVHSDDSSTIFQVESVVLQDTSVLYFAYVWVYMDSEIAGFPELFLDEYVDDDFLLTRTPFDIGEIPFVHGKWVRWYAPFRLDGQVKKIRFWGNGNLHTLDELIIMPDGMDSCKQMEDESYRYNNVKIKKK